MKIDVICNKEPVAYSIIFSSLNRIKKHLIEGQWFLEEKMARMVFNENKGYKKVLRNYILKAIPEGIHFPVFKKGIPVRAQYNILFPHKKDALYKPDCDNLAKTFSDAATGIIYEDDCQISELIVSKKCNACEEWEVHLSFMQA